MRNGTTSYILPLKAVFENFFSVFETFSLRESWMSEVCARGRPCKPPEHWARNLFIDPPSDEEFPAEVAENFDDGQPWHNAPDELSCGELWRALDENM